MIEIRWVKGRAELGNENAQLQFRLLQKPRNPGKGKDKREDGLEWSPWKRVHIVNDDAQLL